MSWTSALSDVVIGNSTKASEYNKLKANVEFERNSTTGALLTTLQSLFQSGSVTSPSIGHSGDTDTGIYFGTNIVYIGTGGTQRVKIDSNGITASLVGNVTGNIAGATATMTGAITGTSIDIGNGAVTDLDSGTYTPTYTNVANTTSATTRVNNWLRIGSIVTVSGAISVVISGAGNFSFTLSIPPNATTTFSDGTEVGGAGVGITGATASLVVTPNAIASASTVSFISNTVPSGQTIVIFYTYTYRI